MAQPTQVSAEQFAPTSTAQARSSFARRVAATIRGMLASPRMPLIVAVLTIIGMLPALSAGWEMDDCFQRATQLGLGDSRPINTFIQYSDRAHNLAQMNFGTMPWWGSPDLHQAFLRYTSVLTMMLDFSLWPNSPAMMHLHSLLWLAAAVLVAALLYREVMGATWVAGLAALMYAIDGAHAVPASYLANRNALVACTFGFLSVMMLVRWREHGRASTRWLSALMLALALSAGEMGLGTVAYLFSYALIVDEGSIRTKAMRLLPHGAVLAIWALIYKLGNFGSHGSGFYTDPGRHPLVFATTFLQRAAFLMMGQWSPLPAEMSMGPAPGSSAFFHLSVFAFIVVAIVAILFIPLVLRDRIARFWGLGVLLAMVPIGAVGPENRLLGFVGLGSMALLAQMTQALFAGSLVAPRLWKGFAWVATSLLLLIHVVAAPFLGLARLSYQETVDARLNRAMASVPVDPQLASQDLVLINPPDHIYLVGTIWAFHVLDHQPMPRHFRALSAGGTLEVTRVGPRSLQFRFPNGFFPTAFSRFIRSPNERFAVGQHFDLPGFSVTVQSLDAHGDPDQVLYEFPVPLEDPSLRWMSWHDGAYVPWTPPAIGHSDAFTPERGIF